ncbi:hypothetical protein HYH03_003006 [Edaphochlamys debaryana]|uniref:Zinc transporter n=1 Tax=Edaphochlamys debaryana TaxID=47281 RepID=A0A835YA06_9CHLO|nr:hypothetical protein HYH03_003006 [Edaphochlamys debaryana]|eukprot:KAG2498813.1 hypothetical protein HYH03_003006 [Edaphochlamys debaryana]
MGGCSGVSSQKLGIAFACVIGAGLASMIGAGIVFLLNFRRSPKLLAAALGFAAGVMLYISAVDIYAGKSVGMFEDAGYEPALAFTYATICFFCGFPIIWVLDMICHWLADRGTRGTGIHLDLGAEAVHHSLDMNQTHASTAADIVDGKDPRDGLGRASVRAATCPYDAQLAAKAGQEGGADADEKQAVLDKEHARKLVRSGILCAVAVALHNLPEGLVTFVGYMESVGSGITTAIAIAIHNIPEGLVISSAMTAGTGSRLKGVLWALLASVSEPLGGLIGLAVVCGGQMTDTVFAILFGLVGGIMVYVSIKELLPNAHRFDPQDKVTSLSVLCGALVMACSLIAIAYSAPEEGEPEVAGEVVPSGLEAPPAPL